MLGTSFFLILTLLAAAVLVVFLLRVGAARAMTVWTLAALLPVLAAMSAAYAGQACAARVLSRQVLAPAMVTVETRGRLYPVTASGNDAACLERATRLNTESDWEMAGRVIPVRQDSTVRGSLPSTEVVEALSVRGELNCAAFHGRGKEH